MPEKNELEKGTRFMMDFTKIKTIARTSSRDVIPVAVINIDTGRLLIIAYVDEQALRATFVNKLATFWSTSKNKLWPKGQTSGDELQFIYAEVNCEQNSLAFYVRPKKGGACHVTDESGNTYKTCYFRELIFDADGFRLSKPRNK